MTWNDKDMRDSDMWNQHGMSPLGPLGLSGLVFQMDAQCLNLLPHSTLVEYFIVLLFYVTILAL